jgi:hypothetical protein
MDAAGVELDRFSKTGLIRRIPAELDPLEPPDPLKCPRAGTKQVQSDGQPRGPQFQLGVEVPILVFAVGLFHCSADVMTTRDGGRS